ncbi:site-specific integrase [Ramlibacter ginsenosidimutans]|uniref:site-specific integrase n=1 Tax=Ramlibacter ginsenosidimutans TaxID=502333 RepID=UPI00363DCE6F
MARRTRDVKQYLRNSLAANTLRAYARDLERFKNAGGRIPATADQVARYLASAADELKPSTLARQIAAISFAHEQRGLQSPTRSAVVRRTLRGIRRTKGVAQKQATPITPQLLKQMVKPLRGFSEAQNRRDAALFLLAFAGGFRRSEIASLCISDLSFTKEGLLVRLRSSKTDQYQRGRDVAIPKAPHAQQCAVRALRSWLDTLLRLRKDDAASDTDRSVFCGIDKHGNVRGRLNSASIGWLLRRRLTLHDLTTDGFTAHSLRSGLVTSAAKAGVPVWAIQRQTGHRSESTVHRYIRGLGAFECNALAGLLQTRRGDRA